VWLAGVIWKLRGPIMVLVGVIALYRGGMLLAAAAVNGFTAAQNILKGVQLIGTLITCNQTKAMALYKAGTMGATIQTTLFWVRQKIAAGVGLAATLGKQAAAFLVLKAQIIASKIATIAYTVATNAAKIATTIWTGVQWALNAALTANPIGIIVVAIGALIVGIVALVMNWNKVLAALKMAWIWIKNVAGIVKDGLCNAFKSLTGFINENSEKILALIAIFTGPFGFVISVIKELKDNWGAIVEAFKTDGIIAGFKKLGGVILSGVLAPIQGLLEILARIPGVDKLLGPAVEKIQEFRNNLKGTETENTIIQNIVPGKIDPAIRTITENVIPAKVDTITPPSIRQMERNTPVPAIPAYNRVNLNNQTISAAATAPTPPMTTAEQYYYSQTTNREQVDIGIRTEPGTTAQVARRPRSPNIRVRTSGGNNG
jgi:hypothetical protein